MSENKPAIDHQAANRSAALRWGSFVVGLLSLQVIGGIIAIMLATGDKSVAVVPDYHQKALDWDEHVAIRAASQRLGWNAEMTQAGEGTSTGLQLYLRDQTGQLVQIESGWIEIFRHARAGQVRRVPISDVAGAITLRDCFDAEGRWQVTLDVRDASGNRFVDSQEIYVVTASADVVRGGT